MSLKKLVTSDDADTVNVSEKNKRKSECVQHTTLSADGMRVHYKLVSFCFLVSFVKLLLQSFRNQDFQSKVFEKCWRGNI